MRIEVGFEVDNDAFGDGHDDLQFGYHIATLLQGIAGRFKGLTRREVGEAGLDDMDITDGNGNKVGTTQIMGYEPPVLTRKEKLQAFFESHKLAEILDALEATIPHYKVPVGVITSDEKLAETLGEDHARITDDEIESIISYLS